MAIEAVIQEALKLSVEERTRLVERLLDSLDETDDPGHHAAWAEVIERRMRDIAEGRVDAPWAPGPRLAVRRGPTG